MSQSRPQVIIIGGGPAGLIASQRLSSSGKFDVHVYEQKGSVARKFLIAGRGGLNLTHSEKIKSFTKRYGPAEEFITPFIHDFSPANMQSWAADLGVETFVGSSGRIFPKEMKATNLMRAWTKRLTKTGVIFHLKHTFIGFDDEKNPQFRDNEGAIITAPADAVLFAMGGASYAHLGATGDWVPLLEEKEIKTEAFSPVNCGFDVKWSDHMLEKFEGQPIKNIRLSYNEETTRGDLVITKYGVEGGAIYALSRSLSEGLSADTPITPKVDLRPDMSRDQIRELLSAPRKKQSLASVLRKKVHLSPLKIALLWEFADREAVQNVETLSSMIKGLEIPIHAMRPMDRAISTAGGITRPMLSEYLMIRGHPGWFAAGEMVDWDAPTGGYLLQACFSMGMTAAKGIQMWIERDEDEEEFEEQFSEELEENLEGESDEKLLEESDDNLEEVSEEKGNDEPEEQLLEVSDENSEEVSEEKLKDT